MSDQNGNSPTPTKCVVCGADREGRDFRPQMIKDSAPTCSKECARTLAVLGVGMDIRQMLIAISKVLEARNNPVPPIDLSKIRG